MATNNNVPNDETRLDNNEQPNETANSPVSTNEPAKAKSSGSAWKSAAAGVAGAAAGVGGAFVSMGFKEVPAEPVTPADHNPHPHPIAEPAHFDGAHVPIAHDVNDDMSFSEAFAAARHEVGAGGVFPWHGGVYGTYYANEWNGFSDAYKQEFSGYHYEIVQEHPVAEPHPEGMAEPIVIDDPHPGNDPHPVDSDVTGSDPLDDIHSPEHDVTVISAGQMDIDGHTVDVVTALVDGHEVAMVDSNLDGNYDIAIVNDNGDPEHPSVYQLDNEHNPVEITADVHDTNDGMHDTPEMHDALYHDVDTSDHLADFNNDADVSNFA